MSFPVTERLSELGGPREESSEHFHWHLFEREFMTLSFSVSTISLKLMKSPTSGRYSPLPA